MVNTEKAFCRSSCDFVLRPALFTLVLEALLCEFYTKVPWGIFYVVLITETQEECISQIQAWKADM